MAAIWVERVSFQKVLDCQARLIAALDDSNADAILSASAALSAAVEELPQKRCDIDPAMLELGLKQTEAARIRVKYLTSWNRQKIDRLAELRGQSSGNIYAKPQESV